MARKVFKYNLCVTDEQKLTLPLNSVILSVINQKEDIVLYAEVDDEEEIMVYVDIYIHGTGHKINDKANLFLGTVSLIDGNLVFHVYGNSNQYQNGTKKVGGNYGRY